MTKTTTIEKPLALILPHRAVHIVWVQSPNGRWLLVAGHWRYVHVASGWAEANGYTIAPHQARAAIIAAIERQMEARAEERLDA